MKLLTKRIVDAINPESNKLDRDLLSEIVLHQLTAALHDVFVTADSELSAIAHGRPPSGKDDLLQMSRMFRDLYEGNGDGIR